MARKPIKIDIAELEKLAALYCTDEEIAAWIGISERQFIRRKEEPAVRAAWERGRSRGRISIRRAQFEIATKGGAQATTLLIFLGKNLLGQRSEPLEGANETRQPKQVIPDWLADDYRSQGVIEKPKPDTAEDAVDPNASAAKAKPNVAVH